MWVEDLDKEGKRKKIWRKLPDLKAGEYLLNQTVGRPKETVEHLGAMEFMFNAKD